MPHLHSSAVHARALLPYPRRLRLAHLPTPLHEVRSTLFPDGQALLVKRDDLTGCAASGNKIRKLEFLLAEAIRRKCDTVITCGGLQSNHARSTVLAAAEVGLKSELFLRGSAPEIIEANYFLDCLAGAQVHWLTAEDYMHRRAELMQRRLEALANMGRRAMIIPEGGSNALGLWGYVKAAQELYRQCRGRADGIVAAVGSGGTFAGLWLGTRLLKWDIPVWGVNICDTADYFRQRIHGELQQAVQQYSLAVQCRQEDLHIIDGYVGAGYGVADDALLQMIRHLAGETGLIMEPVYTAKAFYGMLCEWRQGRFGAAPRLVFVHTGGIFGLLVRQYMERLRSPHEGE